MKHKEPRRNNPWSLEAVGFIEDDRRIRRTAQNFSSTKSYRNKSPSPHNLREKTKTAASKYEDDILKFCEESGLPVAQDDTQIQHSNETALGCLAESLTCEDLNDEIVNV